jgi:hypothetical protein
MQDREQEKKTQQGRRYLGQRGVEKNEITGGKNSE